MESFRSFPARHLATCCLTSLLLAGMPAQARRVALVIGNDAYLHVERLNNAGTDANALAEVLRQTGFAVTVKHDLSLQAMKEALRTFKTQIAGGDQVVFYYSGHGVQFGGTNYLVPVDLTPQSEEQVSDDAVPLQRVLDDLQDMKAGFALAIIDACRNNPFKDASRRAIGGRGLATVTAATGQMVLYSAGAGQEALDSLGPGDRDPNGVFTRVLIREMRVPGVPAEQVLKRVRDQVVGLAQSVKHDQVPALYDQSLGEFYFVSGPAVAATAPAGGAAVQVQSAHELEQEYWNRIKGSTDPRDFQDYQRAFPQGAHTAEATLLTRKFTTPGATSPAAPATGTPPAAGTRAVSVLIAPLTLGNRPVAQAETLMFDQLRSVPGLDPTLSSPGSASNADYGLGGNVLAARPAMTRNQCAGAAKSNKVNIGCLLGGAGSAPYIANVPVQIDFRVSSRADNRVTPFLFSKSYQFPAQDQQEATSTAIEAAIKDGTLAALKSANVIDVVTDPKSKRIGYRVIASPAPAAVLVAAADAGATSRALGTVTGGEISGTWQGSYVCRQGRTGLKLTLSQGAPLGNAGVYAVTGTFEFFPLPDNPMAPAGSYAMEGRLTAGRLSLAGRRWIQQPPGIGMVGINGALANGIISGTIAGGGCSQFEVRRP